MYIPKIKEYNIINGEKTCPYCKKPKNAFEPWKDYPYWNAVRGCILTKPELVKWAVKTLLWSKSEAIKIHKGELKQMWCYKNNIIL